MNPKKILFIVNVDWYLSLHWIERARAAKKAGYIVHFATHFTQKTNLYDWENEGFICHNIKITKISVNVFKDIKGIWKLTRLIKSVNPAIVHCITIKPNIYGGIISFLNGIPCIKSVTGLGVIFSNNSLYFRIIRLIVIQIYRAVDRLGEGVFIFENDEDRYLFKNYLITVKQNSELIRGAGVSIDTYFFQESVVKDITVILFAGRLLRDKGLESLVYAVSNARRQGINITLEVAGIYDKHAINTMPLENLEKWHKQGKITWLGERRDMPNLLARADIVALPTKYGEGLPRILLEAAAIGRPLIASDVAGCRDIVVNGETGLLVNPGDVNSLTKAIVKLAKNPDLRKQMGRAGHARVAKLFAEPLVIKKTLAVYDMLTG